MARNRLLVLAALMCAALTAPTVLPAGLSAAVASRQPHEDPAGVAPPPDPSTGAPPATAGGAPPTVATPDTPAPAPAPPVRAAPKPGAGKAVLKKGDDGRKVTVLQVRLQRVGVYDLPATGDYRRETARAVEKFQRKAGFVRSGKVDKATYAELRERTGKVKHRHLVAGQNLPYSSKLAKACRAGRVVCVDKTANTVRWVVNGKVRMRLDARFGAPGFRTREGVFPIFHKSRDHVSSLYESEMPFAMFFSGGQAVHYSGEFRRDGYAGGSHGCVNTRQYKKMRKLFDTAQVGDRVVVYRSKPVKG